MSYLSLFQLIFLAVNVLCTLYEFYYMSPTTKSFYHTVSFCLHFIAMVNLGVCTLVILYRHSIDCEEDDYQDYLIQRRLALARFLARARCFAKGRSSRCSVFLTPKNSLNRQVNTLVRSESKVSYEVSDY